MVNIGKTMETAVALHSPFSSYDEYYDTSGVFSKKIKVPYKVWRNNKKNILLKPIQAKRFDISTNNSYAILEIVYHGEDYEGDFCNAPLVEETQTGFISSIIPNFNASENETVQVITIHDERFLRLPQDKKAAVLENMRVFVATNDCNFPSENIDEIIHAYTLNQHRLSTTLSVGLATIKPL